LHSQNKTDGEIAECVGIDHRRVADIRKKIGLPGNHSSEKPITLTDIQKQLLIGGIIGDMCIFKDKAAKYHRMNLAHSIKQKSYLLFKANLLGALFSEPYERKWIDQRTKNEYREIRIQSITHRLFTDLYNKWYKNGRKIMHDDVWSLDDLGLAITYFDDGFISSRGYEISLQDYATDDIYKFADVLREKFGLSCTVPGLTQSVYIKAESAERFREILRPFLTKDTEYKL